MNQSEMNQLKSQGYIVVPLIKEDDSERCRTDFMETCDDFPEFVKNRSFQNFKFVNGGFSAFANPASFHNPFVREMRIKAFEKFSEIFEGCGRNAHTLFDRMMLRPIGASATAEVWHRDLTPNLDKDDLMFGGWINFNETSQYFSCVSGTHNDPKDEKTGFSKLENKAYYKSKKSLVDIKPGHMIIFYQNIVHEVLPSKAETPQMRLFTSFRITDSETPLFENNLGEIIRDQGVPKIPSAQDPAMYSKFNWVFPEQRMTIVEWSKLLKDEVCSEYELKSNPGSGKLRVVHRFMHSLTHYGLAKYSEYSPEDLAIFQPQKI